MTDPSLVRDAFLDTVFNTAATLGAALGVSGRAMYESLAPLADDAEKLAHALRADQVGAGKQTFVLGGGSE
ncbi:hypothetical protein ACFWPK_22330 [Nocardia sp. NPDC058519]|uniref:hypothetical protein n=1 Tax=Nocardia sp. NPDC058519 TaxID=3346535 RepID=UPI00365ED4C0